MTQLTRNEYPRPDFVREQWLNLNGEWEFEFDDLDVGETQKWYKSFASFSKSIQVPFAYQSKLSRIGDRTFHNVVWYRRKVTLPDFFSDKRAIVHFGAVDYSSKVWVNGSFAMSHDGGHTPFKADITDFLTSGENTIVVRAEDFCRDKTLPRGKQYWKEDSEGIWYTNTTGIWQTVWLEAVRDTYIEKVKYTPDIDKNEICIRTFINGSSGVSDINMRVIITFNDEAVADDTYRVNGDEESRSVRLHDFNDHGLGRWWSPEKPNLYDVRFVLSVDGKPVDEVKSYFGMRKISIEDGKICLNNRPYFMRLVLDQGYFPEGVLTAPLDEDFQKDIGSIKALGFNGARKHQKVEDPRYLYWCDRMGLLVWGEMANAYQYSEKYVKRITTEWQEALDRDYNHPCIVAWVPINESWGVPNIQVDDIQQMHAKAMYYLTKSLDGTRPVVSNDGWEHVKSDIMTIHDYEYRQEVLGERYTTAESAVASMPANRRLMVGDCRYKSEPIIVSEFGGIAFKNSGQEGWGYSGANSEEDFLQRLSAVVKSMQTTSAVQGFCYTQLTDVEQEINGLLTCDRKPKAPLDKIKEIIKGDK